MTSITLSDLETLTMGLGNLYELVPDLRRFEGKLWTLEEAQYMYPRVDAWLLAVLMSTCSYTPYMVPDKSINLALGHPLSVWLYRYVDTIDMLCSIQLRLAKQLGRKELDQTLIRLPQMTDRFNAVIRPVLDKFHKEAWEEVKRELPEYAVLWSSPPTSPDPAAKRGEGEDQSTPKNKVE